VFDEAKEEAFVASFTSSPAPKRLDYGLKETGDYFFYVADTDNMESETGIYEIISYGPMAPDFAEYF